MKTCTKCGVEKPIADYTKMAKAPDRLGYWCRACRRVYMYDWNGKHPGYMAEKMRNAVSDPVARSNATKRSRINHPAHESARQKISSLVKSGKIPRVSALACFDCGSAAKQYDHAKGYDAPYDVYVEPVCFTCHGKRSRQRGEHLRAVNGRKVSLPMLDGKQWAQMPARST